MLRVITFNLRYDNPRDGENAWPHRRDAVVQLIKERSPALLGIQEGLPHQSAFLREQLADYASVGEGRDGGDRGEYNAIFYRRDLFSAVESGTFWLSETPDIPASRAWDAGCVRIATWALLSGIASRKLILYLNTHLDNRSRLAREKGAALIVDFLQREAAGLPAMVTGDFNALPGSTVLEIMLQGMEQLRLVDTLAAYLGLQPGEMGPATYHGFRGTAHPGNRIDYCLATSDLPVLRAEVLVHSPSGKPVSDHFPVETDHEWQTVG